jgi:hypothetical protein
MDFIYNFNATYQVETTSKGIMVLSFRFSVLSYQFSVPTNVGISSAIAFHIANTCEMQASLNF